jgi:hypothetical protein
MLPPQLNCAMVHLQGMKTVMGLGEDAQVLSIAHMLDGLSTHLSLTGFEISHLSRQRQRHWQSRRHARAQNLGRCYLASGQLL